METMYNGIISHKKIYETVVTLYNKSLVMFKATTGKFIKKYI